MIIENESVYMTNFDRDFFSSLKFRVFDTDDYYGFAGVTSPVPLIAETDEFLVIIDGCYAEVYTTESFENCDGPVAQFDDIRDLPYSLDVSKCEARAGDSDSFSNLGV
jgi:hypothetical protein